MNRVQMRTTDADMGRLLDKIRQGYGRRPGKVSMGWRYEVLRPEITVFLGGHSIKQSFSLNQQPHELAEQFTRWLDHANDLLRPMHGTAARRFRLRLAARKLQFN